MLATSLGSRLPQVDPAYVGGVNAVERRTVLEARRRAARAAHR